MSDNTQTTQLPYLGLLGVLFSHWSVEVLTRAIERANEMIARSGIERAHELAHELAYGNVSLAARASMSPTAEVLSAMRKGFA